MQNEDVVYSQIKTSKKLAQALFTYLTIIEKEHISKQIFPLLSKAFSISMYREYLNEKFIKALFDTLDILEDENDCVSISLILAGICINEASTFFSIYQSHENSRLLCEILLRTLNFEKTQVTQQIICKCLISIMDHQKASVFYSTDLEALIDLLIAQLYGNDITEMQMTFLQVIDRITQYDDYYKTMYKLDELVELIDSYVDGESVEFPNKQIGLKILSNITNH